MIPTRMQYKCNMHFFIKCILWNLSRYLYYYHTQKVTNFYAHDNILPLPLLLSYDYRLKQEYTIHFDSVFNKHDFIIRFASFFFLLFSTRIYTMKS